MLGNSESGVVWCGLRSLGQWAAGSSLWLMGLVVGNWAHLEIKNYVFKYMVSYQTNKQGRRCVSCCSFRANWDHLENLNLLELFENIWDNLGPFETI